MRFAYYYILKQVGWTFSYARGTYASRRFIAGQLFIFSCAGYAYMCRGYQGAAVAQRYVPAVCRLSMTGQNGKQRT